MKLVIIWLLYDQKLVNHKWLHLSDVIVIYNPYDQGYNEFRVGIHKTSYENS